MKQTLLFIITILFSLGVHAQYPILTQRDQAKVIDELLDDRLYTLLPQLMKREGTCVRHSVGTCHAERYARYVSDC